MSCPRHLLPFLFLFSFTKPSRVFYQTVPCMDENYAALRGSTVLFHLPSTPVLGYHYTARFAGWISGDSLDVVFRKQVLTHT
jgi:hypothetical protein